MNNIAETALAAVKKDTAIEKPKVIQIIDEYKEDFISLFPNKLDGIRYYQIMINTFRTTPDLFKCDIKNSLACFVICATAGLEPNTIAHECCIIPEKVYDKTTKQQIGTVATIQYEWRGLKKLAENTGLIKVFDYGIVREGDDFVVEKGMNPKFSHIPNYFLDETRKAQVVYCYTELMNGAFVFTAKNYDSALAHGKKFSKSYWGAWTKSPDSMCLKTVFKEHFDKKLMKSSERNQELFSKILQAENQKLELPENFKISKDSIDQIEAEYLEVPEEDIQDVFYSKETGEIFDGKN